MKLFVIGDIHGCLNTFQALLQHWDPHTEQLVQVGDLINKGRHSLATIALAQDLQRQYQAVFLRGNHEHEWLKYWANPQEDYFLPYLRNTLNAYQVLHRSPEEDLVWMNELPLFWENHAVFISHAGIGQEGNPFDLDHRRSLLWNRRPLKRLDKLQIVGHTPQANHQVRYDIESHALYLDTGAFLGGALSAARIDEQGLINDLVSIPTHSDDL
jgi:serine/threonine protein phosphatase 1